MELLSAQVAGPSCSHGLIAFLPALSCLFFHYGLFFDRRLFLSSVPYGGDAPTTLLIGPILLFLDILVEVGPVFAIKPLWFGFFFILGPSSSFSSVFFLSS